jgi:hypothetical protein
MRNKLPSTFASELRKRLLEAALDQRLGFASSSATKFDDLRIWLANQLEVDADEIAIYWAGGQKQVTGRARQVRHAAGKLGHPFTLTLVISSHSDSCAVHAREGQFAARIVIVCKSPPTPKSIEEISITHVVANDSDAGPFISVIPKVIRHDFHVNVESLSVDDSKPATASQPGPGSNIKIDSRIERMVKTSIASTSAVILVGPPGTGKSQLLRQMIAEIRSDPTALGFTQIPNEPKWVTAEEGWTTRDLLGGESVDENQRLRFALGHVLDAIRENRWLVVDEMNRADMDKIFGALLTWLSQAENAEVVDIGRASTAPNSPSVQLGWAAEASCSTSNLSRLTAADIGVEPLRFMAGTEWRLLGTYNAVDAHRVFRFGQALGRRFVRVPIPAVTPAIFGEILVEQHVKDSIARPLLALYAAHYSEVTTRLGPALFLHAARYVRTAESSVAPPTEALAEGYLVTVGTWLASLDPDDLVDLGTRICNAEALPVQEWDWICSMIPSLR